MPLGYRNPNIAWYCVSSYTVLSGPSLLNINNSWLTLILCNSAIVSGQESIKFSSLSSFHLDGMLNISCHWPLGQVSMWLDECSRRTYSRCFRKAYPAAVQWCSSKNSIFGCSFLVMKSNSVLEVIISVLKSSYHSFLFSFFIWGFPFFFFSLYVFIFFPCIS